MISVENIKYSLRNLWIRKARSFLTVLSIFVGIMTIFLFISYGWGLYIYVEDVSTGGAADKFMVEGRGFGGPGTSSVLITDDDLETVQKTLGVAEATPSYFGPGAVKQGKTTKYVYVTGYDPKTDIMFESFDIGVEKGRLLDSGDTGKVVLGYNYLVEDKIFSKTYDLNDNIEIDGQKFRVVGFVEEIGNPTDDANVYMTLKTFENTYPDVDSYTMIFGKADIDEMDQTVDRIKKNLRKDRGEKEGQEELSVASFVDQIEAFQTVLNMIIGFIILIAFISVIVSAINTANTMVTSVLERVKEIGIIKSIGAKNSEIFNIFLFESSFLGFLAGVIGVGLGYILCELVYAFLDSSGWGFLAPHYSWSLFLGCVAFATFVGAISGVAPALNAAKRRPVDALRYE
jgi:putative ABC transport system permease protein